MAETNSDTRPQGVPRRWVLGAGGLTVAGIALRVRGSEVQERPISPEQAILNAASIRIAYLLNTFAGIPIRESYGHGGLYRRSDGSLSIMTAYHVIDGGDGGSFQINIPEVTGGLLGHWNINNLSWERTSNDIPGDDPVVAIRCTGELARKLEQAIRDGKIIPLVAISPDTLSPYEVCVTRADDGRLTRMALDGSGFHLPTNRLLFTGEDFYMSNPSATKVTNIEGGVCSGYSGGPALRLDRSGRLTNQSVGVLSHARYRSSSNPKCTAYSFEFTPHGMPASLKEEVLSSSITSPVSTSSLGGKNSRNK